jgi:hypothetical protein
VRTANQESVDGKPDAVLDTNVGLAIYSWHDLIASVNSVVLREPTATLEHPEIQFRAQRARSAFLLTLFLHENKWHTLVPLNEWTRLIVTRAPPSSVEDGEKSNFVRFYIYFVKDKLLSNWQAGGDISSDDSIKGNEVDRLCLDWAGNHKIPLISWEGHGPAGFDASKLIPREAKVRGIDLVTPDQLLIRNNFNEQRAIRRFLSDWNANIDEYLVGSPDARETLGYARSFFQRLAENDWTP